ncbi:MAG: tetratricopeptide repeat protein [Planctomycetaceae bacterium]|nr:tetratricopeptide repeat protein [Planctomycetaceae bacterium]
MTARVLRTIFCWGIIVVLPGCGPRPPRQIPPAQTQTQSSAEARAIAPDRLPLDERRHDVYVGSQRCAGCHQQIYEQYTSSHPMARSINLLSPTDAAVSFSTPFQFSEGGREYEVTTDDAGRMFHSESQLDSDGPIYRQRESVEFAIGSGQRGYSFVHSRHGSFYQSPLTWYTGSQKWGLSPGYQPERHPRFGRRMTGDCMFCHAGHLNTDPASDDRFLDPPFHEPSISCERCHGPGHQHVQFHEFGEGGRDEMVNPDRLEPRRRDSVCYQCHLHGKARIVRDGRSSFDFRPGDAVSDIWAVLVENVGPAAGATEFEAVSQPEQMTASVCYQKSGGQLGCISCHSPHGIPAAQQRVAFYRDRCLNCHAAPQKGCSVPLSQRHLDSPEDSCIVCHMPAASASDVPHTAQTDHRILRRYVTSGKPRPRHEPALFQKDDFPLSRAEIQRALGLQLESTAATRTDANAALRLLGPAVDRGVDTAAATAAAWLLLKLGDLETAQRLAERALEQTPADESALEARSIALQQQGQFAEALQMVDRILQDAPWSAVIQSQRADLLASLGRTQEAIAALERSLEIDPTALPQRRRIITLLNASGDAAAAKRHQQTLNRLIKAARSREPSP